MNRDRCNDRMSRRDVFKAAAAVAAAQLIQSPASAQRAPGTDDAGTLDGAWRQAPTNRQPIVLRGGTIVSMDPKVGDFARGDVLIDGRKIVSVGETVKAPPQAQVLDATNTIDVPLMQNSDNGLPALIGAGNACGSAYAPASTSWPPTCVAITFSFSEPSLATSSVGSCWTKPRDDGGAEMANSLSEYIGEMTDP